MSDEHFIFTQQQQQQTSSILQANNNLINLSIDKKHGRICSSKKLLKSSLLFTIANARFINVEMLPLVVSNYFCSNLKSLQITSEKIFLIFPVKFILIFIDDVVW